VAASIIGDLRYPDGIRRRALVVVLTLADAASRKEEARPETLSRVASCSASCSRTPALSPLERLYEHEDGRVRRAAVRALRFLFFKRSFVLIRRGLADPDPIVRDAAIEALRGLHFPHAFNPLARIYREADDARVQDDRARVDRQDPVGRSGRVPPHGASPGEGELREVSRRALAGFDNSDVLPIVRQYAQIETNAQVREALDDLLRTARA
jgi:hypothetical protein